jgi:hypothetical protein
MASEFESLWRGSFAAKEACEDTIRHMPEMIEDPVILKKLIPDWEFGVGALLLRATICMS